MNIDKILKILDILGIILSMVICVVSYIKQGINSIFITYIIIGLMWISSALLKQRQKKK